MKTFHILTVLTKRVPGFDAKWADYQEADSLDECKDTHEENLYRYGVIDFAAVTYTEVDPQTLKPLSEPVVCQPL